MKLAVMQPYFLPYIGYYQMMNAVDRFVLYDDVCYINRGWINRNRIQINRQPWMFTLPLSNASQNVLIKDLIVSESVTRWSEKFKLTLRRAYAKAPEYGEVECLIYSCLSCDSQWLMDWILQSLDVVCDYLSIPTHRVRSSERYPNTGLKRQDRILDMCRREKTTTYINGKIGQALYSPAAFAAENTEIRIMSTTCHYKQFEEPFIPHLSIIDVLMFNNRDQVQALMGKYEFV
jgi:hypothetical protein